MIAILQNRDLTIADRILLILGMAHDMQGRMNRQEMFDCSDVIHKYTTDKALQFVKNYQQKSNRKQAEAEFAHTMFQHLYELELLREEWGILLKETEDLLYRDKESYGKMKEEFQNYLKTMEVSEKQNNKEANGNTISENEYLDINTKINISIHLEQLLVYFLFTYYPGAVYDGEIYAKVQLAVYCVWMIWEIWMARWLKNEKNLDLEEMTELVYRFSREVEHSDLNLREIEKILSKKWFLTKK